jgi:broad specificity phosphatase PhoE
VLLLVRHGESEANAAGLLVGRSDPPLTGRGRDQAVALGARLRRHRVVVARVVSSPLTRAHDTAVLLGSGVEAEVDARWIEVDYGQFEGVAVADVPVDTWRAWRADVNFRPPAGESLAEVGERVREACEEQFARPGNGARADADVVVVSHVSPIKAAVAWALGAGDELAWRLQLATGSLTRIGWGASGPVLVGYNEVPGS